MKSTNKLFAIAISLAWIVLLVGLLPVHGETAVYESVVRLHVLANSDSEEDQAQKLRVRDAVLAEVRPLLHGVSERDEAVRVLCEHGEDIRNAALSALRAEGSDRTVSVSLGRERYPTRTYAALRFPAGEYLSLRVSIGEGEGQNWWCVLFPPLCLSAATGVTEITQKEEAQEVFVELGMTADQYKIITESESNTYAVRFKILEDLEQWRKK